MFAGHLGVPALRLVSRLASGANTRARSADTLLMALSDPFSPELVLVTPELRPEALRRLPHGGPPRYAPRPVAAPPAIQADPGLPLAVVTYTVAVAGAALLRVVITIVIVAALAAMATFLG